MTASLQIKKNKYYIVLCWIENGKQKQKWKATGLDIYGSNKRKAEKMKLETLRDFQDKSSLKDFEVLFSDYLKEWLEIAKDSITVNTYYTYKQTIHNSICPWFEKKKIKLCDMKPYQIQDFYRHKMQDDGVSANTIYHYHANIRKALNYAVKTERIKDNPALKVDLPKKEKHISHFYSIDELNTLIKSVKGTNLETVIMLASWFGLRRGEIIGLKWDFIDLDNKLLTIAGTMKDKGESGSRIKNMRYEATAKTTSSFRTFPLHENAVNYLAELKKNQDIQKQKPNYNHKWDGFVCVKANGDILPLDYVTRTFPKLCQNAGLPKLKLHELRHTNISLLLNAGANMKELQEWAGHSSYTTTANFYSHLTSDSKQKLSLSIEKLII